MPAGVKRTRRRPPECMNRLRLLFGSTRRTSFPFCGWPVLFASTNVIQPLLHTLLSAQRAPSVVGQTVTNVLREIAVLRASWKWATSVFVEATVRSLSARRLNAGTAADTITASSEDRKSTRLNSSHVAI